MPIRRRDHGLARAKRISECSRGNLGFLQIRSNVKIRRPDELGEFLQFYKAVVKDDILFEVFVSYNSLEAEAVSFASSAELVGVSASQHDIGEIGKLRHHLLECMKHVLNPFIRREQSERQQNLPSVYGELALVEIRSNEWHIRNTMRDEIDYGLRSVVHLLQDDSCPLRHYHQAG